MENTKSIANLMTELQIETEKLQQLHDLFDQACEIEFGYDIKTIHQKLDRQKLNDQRRAETYGKLTTFSSDEE